MTDSTIDGKYLTFIDGWPASQVLHAIPPDGFNGSGHHNVSTPQYPPGTKITVYNNNALSKGRAGWVTFIYLQCGTCDLTTVLAARHLVVPSGTGTVGVAPYRVSNAADAPTAVATGQTMVAIALGAMTAEYYGWFQCAGVPAADMVVSGSTYVLDSTFKTIGDIDTGHFMTTGSASGNIKLANWATLTSLAVEAYCGYASYTDT